MQLLAVRTNEMGKMWLLKDPDPAQCLWTGFGVWKIFKKGSYANVVCNFSKQKTKVRL